MAETNRIFDLDALRRRVAGRIRIAGTEYDVLQLTGATVQSLRRTDDPAGAFERALAASRRCAPDVPADAMTDLNVDQIMAIVTMAGAGIAAVEVMFPNVNSPEQAPTSPG